VMQVYAPTADSTEDDIYVFFMTGWYRIVSTGPDNLTNLR